MAFCCPHSECGLPPVFRAASLEFASRVCTGKFSGAIGCPPGRYPKRAGYMQNTNRLSIEKVWWARKPILVGKLIETNAPKPREIVPPAFSARRRRAGSADSIGPGSIERERRLAATSRRNKATTFVHKSGKAPLHHRRPHSHRRRAWKRRRDRPQPLGRRP
jgi:hypothetical protein